MADESRASRQRLLDMVNGFMLSRALYAFTVLGLDEQDGFELTPRGEGLREDAPGSLAG